MKLYIVSDSYNGTEDINGIYYLISEKGEMIDYHFCSNKNFAMDDLCNNLNNQDLLKEKFGEGFKVLKVLYLGEDSMTKEKLIELNKNFNKS